MLLSIALTTALLGALDAPVTTATPAPEPDDWSVGVGVGLTMVPLGGVGSGLGALGQQVTYGVAAERRVAGDLWVRAHGGLAYWDFESELGSPLHTTVWAWSAAVGARYGFWRSGSLALSALAMANWRGADQDTMTTLEGTPAPVEARQRSRSVGGGAGLAVDYELAPGLDLRFESQLASITWSWFAATDPQVSGGETLPTGSWLSANFEFAPSLELRLRF